jgi:hypothetical protein
MDIKLRRFDMGHVGSNRNLLIVGQPKAGTTTMILDYLNYNSDLPIGIVTPKGDCVAYIGKVPAIFIHQKITNELIDHFVKRQIRVSKQAVDHFDTDPRAFFVLDGTLTRSLQEKTNEHGLSFVVKNNRRLNITSLFGVSDPDVVRESLLRHMDFVIVFGHNGESYLKKVYQLISNHVEHLSYDRFARCVRYLSERYSALVIDLKKTCSGLEERIFWYKADTDRLQHFRICLPEYWVIHR